MRGLLKFLLVLVLPALLPTKLWAQSSALAGKWQCPFEGYTMELELKPDGSGTLDGAPIQYQATNHQLTVREQDQTVNVYTYQLSNGQLLVSGGDLDGPLTFKKAGGTAGLGARAAAAKGNSATTTKTASSAKDPGNSLLGTWAGSTGTFVFNANGQGTANGAPMTYSTQGDQLTLNDGAANVTLQFRVSNNTLALTGAGGTIMFAKGGTAANGGTGLTGSGRQTSGQELVGKWCYVTSNYNSLGAQTNTSATEECIVIKADGTYEYASESSRSAGSATFYGGTTAADADAGTWRYDGGNTISVVSQKTGAHTYTIEKRNHPKTGDPMLFIDGRGYVTFYQKPGW